MWHSSRNKKNIIRALAGCLTVLVLMTGNGAAVFAESVSNNQILTESTISSNGLGDRNIEQISLESSTNDTYVYFGSYPSTLVLDEQIKAAIDAEIQLYHEGKKVEEVDGSCVIEDPDREYKLIEDVWIGDSKYRRISDLHSKSYYKWNRIKWQLLKKEGNSMLLGAYEVMDERPYYVRNTETADWEVTWETSYLREWLNTVFYQAAFTEEEQAAILLTDNENPGNDVYGTSGGANTKDFIWIPTVNDVKEYNYFAWQGEYSGKVITCWIRNPGENKENAVGWNIDNGIFRCFTPREIDEELFGIEGTRKNGVLPFLRVNATSDCVLYRDDGTSGEGGEKPILTNIRAGKTKTVYTQGEALTLDDLQVTATYRKWWKNNEEIIRTLKKTAFKTNAASLNMKEPGAKTLVISYKEKGVKKSAAIPIQVKAQNRITGITLKAPSKKLAAGKTVGLTLRVTPENATNKKIAWKSSNDEYASVDQDGRLTLKKAGAGKSVTITASAQDGSNKTATLKIKIMKHAVKSIKLKAPSKKLKAGKSMMLKTVIKTTGKKANKKLTFTSSNTNYAVVNSKGKVTAKKAGKGKKVTITVKATDGSNKKAKITIKVK